MAESSNALDLDVPRVARLENTGGLRATPTPGGVPVAMTSPGSSEMLFVMNL